MKQMELTRKVIEELSGDDIIPEVSSLAKQLLAEMDKPKVWDGAPNYAGRATVTFEKGGRDGEAIWSKVYTREPAKSRIDEIAEEAASKWYNNQKSFLSDSLSDAIKSAILKDREEREPTKGLQCYK